LGKIFISHSSANNAEALAISDWLAEQGWGDVFLDLDPKRGLVAGDRWQAALKAAAEQCELILILISPDWAKSRWCLAEFLLAKQMNKQILGVVVQQTPLADLPVELTAEWQLVDLSAADAGWSITISPPRFEPETTVHFSGTGLARLRAGLEKAGLDATTFLWPPAHDLGRAPYRGLLPLDQDDAGIFFGRDGAIVLTLDKLRGLRSEAAPRFATILGASGAGKSSFLRAGILPRLARDSRHFYVLPVLRPERAALTGEHGLAHILETALKGRGISRNKADIKRATADGADAVAAILRELAVVADVGDVATGDPPTIVLAIDQAEELLTADNAEAGAFLQLLAELGNRDDLALLVIFTVRSDSFDQLQSRPELASTQPHHLIDLPPVPAGSFGDIIRGPARRLTAMGRKLHVDETLVDALLADIEQGGTKDALPLLAFTLERLYTDYGADGDLQLDEYEKLGRIRGAIEAAVEEALRKADGNAAIPRDRLARLALLRRGLIPWLAGIDPVTGSPRRRVARLAEVPEEARPLIELMVEQRLLATDIDSSTRETTIEPAHEALLRQWGALDGWLAEDSADLSAVEALRRAASEWDANARASEFIVHRGARLQATEHTAGAGKFATYLTSIDQAYLSAARNVENAAIKKARAARTRLAIAASFVGVVLVAGATAGYFIWSAGEAARRQAAVNFEIARAEASLRAGRPEEGAAAALGAYALQPDSATRTMALTAAMAISPNANGTFPVTGRVVDAAFLDLQRVAVLTAAGDVTIIDTETRQAVAGTPLPADPLPMALAADGQGGAVVVRNDTSLVGLDGKILAAPTATEFFSASAKTSADGSVVLFKGLIGDLLVRDCRSLPCVDTLLPLDGLNPDAADVRPDGSAIAVHSSDSRIALFERDFGAPPRLIAVQSKANGKVSDVAFSGDNQLAITGSSTLVVDLTTGKILSDNDGLASSIVAWSPRGQVVALACDTTSLCLHGVDGHRIATYQGHVNPVRGLRWSPDAKAMVSFAPNDPVRLWTIADDLRVASVLPSKNWLSLTSLAVDRPRGLIAAGDERGTLWLWSELGVAEVPSIPDVTAAITSLAFLSDGRLAAVHQNEAVSVWTLGNREPDKLLRLDNLSFSRIAALGGDIRAAVPLSDKTVLVLSGDDLRESRVASDTMPLDQWGLVAAPEANAAFISYSDGTIRRRDLGAGGEGAVVFDASQPICGVGPTTDNNGSRSLDVSADGKWLVATRSDAALVVHNLADPAEPICLALPAPESKTVAFSPDSSKLAILSATDRLYVFDLAAPETALIFGAPAVPDNSPLAVAAGSARTTSWLAWRDDSTLAVATTAGAVETIVLEPDSWRARVDTLAFTP
jgi:WD40 repeat protein